MDVELADVCVVVIGCAGLSTLVFASSPVHDIASSMPLRSYLGPMSALPVPGLVVFASFAFIASPLRPHVGAVALHDSCWLASGCDRADCRAASCKPMHCQLPVGRCAPAPHLHQHEVVATSVFGLPLHDAVNVVEMLGP